MADRASMRNGLNELFRKTEADIAAPADPVIAPMSADEPYTSGAYVTTIKVVGIGGAGTNAVNRMVDSGIRGVEFIAVNTDVQALAVCDADVKIHVGQELTHGLGGGADADVGRRATEDSRDELKQALRGADLVFVTAGEGGGTGTGGAPVIASVAREVGALAVAIVTLPFSFEGFKRGQQARDGVERLRQSADTVISIPNDRLLGAVERSTTVVDAFRYADDVLRQGVQGITDLITIPGLINLDFADVRTIVQNAGTAIMGVGQATGDNRANEAATASITSPLLDSSIQGARGILLNITGGSDLSLYEVNEAARIIADAADEDANIIFGAVVDERRAGTMTVTVIATGFAAGEAERTQRPSGTPQAAVAIEEPDDKPGMFGRVPAFEEGELDIPSFVRHDDEEQRPE
jgi:cell division protein FtsZ